ncbi:unnamed protein product (macronuclear) [Paramecium tetraurelia]|uniref:Nudix hydrolase domain-containing protein n=1 Tax=Paramecium tetraurelia TaxID=5888 RepID=A0BV43_PARTE|nr:uncharacterized protein GSPATT00005656001 [Paramecium tetraurelia]CAK62410.1 unnamed protein product [Paramecium tetraurelia]|eukprot:XP_001429808.1 hypothetical protein (macronuclear) [Paramecium tetraurelia strain d4-2]
MTCCQKSASLILIRDDFKVLMLKRSNEISFGGSFVFPGGILEETDYKIALADSQLIQQNQQRYYCSLNQDWYDASLIAAIRETTEETNIQLEYKQLYSKIKPFMRIVTPQMMEKRYDTQFFVLNLNNYDQLEINKTESASYEWDNPVGFLQKFINSQIYLQPPIFLQLLILNQLGITLIQEINKNMPIPIFSNLVSYKGAFNYPDPNFNLQKLLEAEQTDYLKKEFKTRYTQMERSDFRFEFEANLKSLTGFIGKFKNSPLALLDGQIINNGQFIQNKARL